MGGGRESGGGTGSGKHGDRLVERGRKSMKPMTGLSKLILNDVSAKGRLKGRTKAKACN